MLVIKNKWFNKYTFLRMLKYNLNYHSNQRLLLNIKSVEKVVTQEDNVMLGIVKLNLN